MLSFAHLMTLLAFIAIGALGMAAMQDGLSMICKHLGLGRRVHTRRPLMSRIRWAKPSLR